MSVPSPVDVVGPVRQAVGDALKSGAGSVMDGLGTWLFSSLGELTAAVFGFVDKAAHPNVMSAWFINGSNGTGPYKTMGTVAATIMGVLVFAGIVQGVVQADVGGMVRRMAVNLPMAVIGIGGTVVVVQILIDLTDGVSAHLTSSIGGDTQTFVSSIQQIATATGSTAAPLLVLGLLMLVAALVVFVELLVRSLLIYLIVALCPLAWAALVWPSLQGALRKTLELLVAVILSKVVVALAIAVGSAALSATALSGMQSPELAPYAMPGGAVTSTAPAAGGMTESLGLLATGVATLAVAAFSPFLIARLLPFAEGAVVAQGTRGAPVRASQQVWSMKHQLDMSRRFGGGSSPASSPGSGSSPLAGGSSSPRRRAGGGASVSGLGGGKAEGGSGVPRPNGGSGGGGAARVASGAGGRAARGAGAAGGVPAVAGGASAAAGPIGLVAAADAGVAKTGKAALGRTQASVAEQTRSAATAAPSSAAPSGAGATGGGSGSSATPAPSTRRSSTDRIVSRPTPATGGKP